MLRQKKKWENLNEEKYNSDHLLLYNKKKKPYLYFCLSPNFLKFLKVIEAFSFEGVLFLNGEEEEDKKTNTLAWFGR